MSLLDVPSGNKVEKVCDLCNITVNKNAVFGDSSALAPGGVRIGKYSIFELEFAIGSIQLMCSDRNQ